MRGAYGVGLLLVGLALASPAWAKPVQPDDPVPGHPGLTYLDLVRQEVRDLAPNKDDDNALEGTLPTPPPRHLAGPGSEGDSPDPVTLDWIEDMRILAGGKHRMVILADLGPDPDRVQSQTLLLLFDDDVATPKLLDAADVGLDKDTEFDEHTPMLPLGPGEDALVTVSEHDDADISFDARMIVFVRRDRLQQVANYYVVNEDGCSWKQRQTATVTTPASPGSAYSAVDIRIVHSISRVAAEGCNDPPHKPVRRVYEAIYRWNAKLGRFTTTSKSLKQLADLNSTAN